MFSAISRLTAIRLLSCECDKALPRPHTYTHTFTNFVGCLGQKPLTIPYAYGYLGDNTNTRCDTRLRHFGPVQISNGEFRPAGPIKRIYAPLK